jgi:hypothetical protein
MIWTTNKKINLKKNYIFFINIETVIYLINSGQLVKLMTCVVNINEFNNIFLHDTKIKINSKLI